MVNDINMLNIHRFGLFLLVGSTGAISSRGDGHGPSFLGGLFSHRSNLLTSGLHVTGLSANLGRFQDVNIASHSRIGFSQLLGINIEVDKVTNAEADTLCVNTIFFSDFEYYFGKA
jgi:hypothetical protein